MSGAMDIFRRPVEGAIWALAGAALIVSAGAGCAEDVPARPAPPGAFHFPTSLAVTPDGRYLLAVNTNFNLEYDAGAIVVVDLLTHEFLEDAAIEVPSYGGVLALRESADGRLVGYLPDRTKRALNWFYADADADGQPNLSCRVEPYDGSGLETCEDPFRMTSGTVGGETVRLGSDPFGVGIRDTPTGEAWLLTGSLGDGTLGVFSLDGGGRPRLVDRRRLGDAGLYGIATSPSTGITYVATQFAQRLYTVVTDPNPLTLLPQTSIDTPPPKLDDPPEVDSPVVAIGSVDLPNADSGSTFAQSIVFDSASERAFVTFRAPAAVAVLDTSPLPDGRPLNRLLAWIPVGDRPAEMALIPGSSGSLSLYVVCFGSNEVFVVDAQTLGVVDVISTGHGPYDIVFTELPEYGVKRAYVSLFSENAVAVIDLDPQSPYFHRVVSHIR